MSTNDGHANVQRLDQYDRAIMDALMKSPQALRFNDLHRRSGLNVRTFNKHLNGLVSTGAVEKTVVARNESYYKLMIDPDIKEGADHNRSVDMDMLENLEKAPAKRSQGPGQHTPYFDDMFELLIDWIGYSVKNKLLSGFHVWRHFNPVTAGYIVDVEMEKTRDWFNRIAVILDRSKEKVDFQRISDRIDERSNVERIEMLDRAGVVSIYQLFKKRQPTDRPKTKDGKSVK